MKVTKKDIRKILENKPETFKGTQFEWRKLIKSIIIPPDKDYEWIKNKDTDEWERVRI
jgi:hypothetical protein